MKRSLLTLIFIYLFAVPMLVTPQSLVNGTGSVRGQGVVRRGASASSAITWQNLVNVTQSGTDNMLTKTGGSNGTWDAGAFSTNSFTGNGYITFKTTETTGSKMAGLSLTDPGQAYDAVLYGIYMVSDGTTQIYEGGSQKLNSGTYTTSTVFKVERIGTEIKYYKDGSLYYTSLVSSSGTLHIKVIVLTSNNTVGSVTISP